MTKMFPRVLLIANKIAEGSINLVMFMIFSCVSGVDETNIAGIILSIKMKAITESAEIKIVAPVSIVFAILYASFLSFIKYSLKIGKNAAVNAPAINRLNSISGIKNDAL
jgi:hypothetical protein